MSISSSNNSGAFNIKGRQQSLQEEDEPSYDPNLIQKDLETGNRGQSQNSVRLEGTTLDATEDDIMEESYTLHNGHIHNCLLYTSPSPRDATLARKASSA